MATATQVAVGSPRWDAAAEEHRLALATFVVAAGAVDGVAWERPWMAGKWTPAEITEHLSLAYEALIRELRDGTPMQPRLSPWRQRVTRWILLPHILFHRTFPLRAPAPRELRPGAPRAGQREALRLLEQLADRFEEELARAFRAGGGMLSHPYFGRVDAVRALRFVGVHVEHHRRQVERAGG